MSAPNPQPQIDPESAAMHRELQEQARRFALRFDPAYWRCPTCHQGATNIEPWGTVWWAWCEVCSTRGAVGENVLDPPRACDEDGRPFPAEDRIDLAAIDRELLEQFRYEWIVALSRFHDLSTGAHPMERLFRKKLPANDPNFELIDRLFNPWAGYPRPGMTDPDDPSTPPANWHKLRGPSAERAGLTLVEGDPDGLPAGITLGPWRRMRARGWLPADQGESGATADALRPYYISDPTERERWRQAVQEVQAAGPFLLSDALRKLKASGDLLSTLRARRDDLDRQIARLERRLALVTAEGAGAGQ